MRRLHADRKDKRDPGIGDQRVAKRSFTSDARLDNMAVIARADDG
jgi:hypothetical protein